MWYETRNEKTALYHDETMQQVAGWVTAGHRLVVLSGIRQDGIVAVGYLGGVAYCMRSDLRESYG